MASKSLFEKYGGFSKINQIVISFYDALLDDDEVGPYFDDVDMDRLIDHQTKFIAYLLGGPADFGDDHLRRAHASVGVTDPHFDRMKEILGAALTQHGVSEEDLAGVLAAIEARRSHVVA